MMDASWEDVCRMDGDERESHADLHMHSAVSDGSCTAYELACMAWRAGLTHMAITDHDTTAGIDEALRAAAAVGIAGVGGVEISAYDFIRGRKVHILGLGMGQDSPAVEALCSPVLERRDQMTRWQLDVLLELGHQVNVDLFEQLAARSTCAYKQHLMAALTSASYSSREYRSLYRSLFKGEGPCARDIAYVDARDAVRAILEDGGVPVLAHPGQTDSWDFLPELVSCGLAGIEVWHPDHTSLDVSRALEAASGHGLLCTGGSDFHGAFGAPPQVGFCQVGRLCVPLCAGRITSGAHQQQFP